MANVCFATPCLLLSAFLFLFLLLFLFPSAEQNHLTLLFSSFNPVKTISDPAPLQSAGLSLLTSINDGNNHKQISPYESPSASIYKSTETINKAASSTLKKKSSLETVEVGLAGARAAIREAIRSRNYTSEKKETFIPRGSVYRNPYAFHQSHIEMMKRFKVWTYEEGETPLVHNGPVNDIYSIEGQLIAEIESEGSPFKAQNPDDAHVFFLPFSVASIIHYVYTPITKKTEYSRDRLQRIVTDYIEIVATKYPYWNRSNGADHFMVSCHDWAPDVSRANPKLFNNFIRVLCNANTSEGFLSIRDVPLPEIYLEVGSLGPPKLGQPPTGRHILAFFSGGAHGHIRHTLFKYWKNKDNEVQVYERLPKGLNYTQLMGRSKFCLCPSGFEVASPRVVESINQGCVPVIISDNYSLPFSDVLNWSQISIQIPVERIAEIKEILLKVPESKYFKMYKSIKKVQKHFVLNRPAKPYDVIHMVFHSLWLRRLNFRLATGSRS